MTRRYPIIATLLGALLLAACSSAPDANDVEQAIEANIRSTMAQHRVLAAKADGDGAADFKQSLGVPEAHEIDISDVTIQQSDQLDSGNYRLEVTYSATVQDISRKSSTQVLMSKHQGKWTVLN